MTHPSRLTDDERRNFIRYTNTRHWPMLRRFPVAEELHDELLAQMLGWPPETAQAVAGVLADETRAAAAEMLADGRYREALRRWPFRPEDRVVAVGDSITADRLGWFELLSASAALAGSPTGEMINLGVSGNTTADVLERFDLLESERPSHVLLLLGTNDARSHGRTVEYRMATTSETERNVRALLDLIGNGLGATTTVITPPAVDQQRIGTFFSGAPVRWHATDVAEVAEVIRKVVPAALDLHSLLPAGGTDDILEADGVHPTAAGQRLIAAHVAGHLGSGGGGPHLEPGDHGS